MKKSNKLLLALGLSLTLGYVYHQSTKENIYPPYREIPLQNVDDLEINTTNQYRGRFVDSESSGIEKLSEFANDAKSEESWAYLPNSSEWIEIGVNPPYNNFVYPNYPSLYDILKSNDDVTIYTLHPFSVTYDEMKNMDVSTDELTDATKAYLPIPRIEEFEAMIIDSLSFYEDHNDGKIVHRIVSPEGITEYKLSKKGKKWFMEQGAISGMSDLAKEIIVKNEYLIPLDQEDGNLLNEVFDGSKEPESYFNHIFSRHLAPKNKPYLEIDWIPFEK